VNFSGGTLGEDDDDEDDDGSGSGDGAMSSHNSKAA
jgi:hypothetical protein